jgi:predicted ATPase
MLERLRIQNFKSWQDTGDMAFGSLTGFFGTNSSGKSSILQFLLMLKQTVESSDRSRVLHLGDDKSYVDLGTIDDILFMHKESTSLSFSMEWQTGGGFVIPEPYEDERFQVAFGGILQMEVLSFNANVRKINNVVRIESLQYKHNAFGIEIGVKRITKGINKDKYSVFGKDPEFKQDNFTIAEERSPIKFYDFPSLPPAETRTPLNEKLEEYPYQLERFYSQFHYLGPLREYPSRLYVWAGEQTQSVGNRGERAVAALLSSRNQGPTINMGEGQPKRTVEEHVAHWLKELGLIYSFKVQPIAPNRKEYEVRIQRTAESASVFLTDVGFGVSQILPVLVLLFYVPEGSTVILEQPEIHLHPAVQAGLADVFIDAIKRRKLQIILESHSEHLLQRLQRRMAEEVIAPDDIKLYFTSIEAGKSKLTPLQLDEYGNINNWPEGFFGDTMGEAAAMMKAEMERRMRQQPS